MRILIAIALFLAATSTDAEAKRRGVAIIGFGEDIAQVAELPEEVFDSNDLGLYHQSFRLFFVPVVTWDKRLVLYNDSGYYDLEAEDIDAITEHTGPLTFKGNLWVKWVNYLWPALLVGFIVFRIHRKRQLAQIDEEFAHLN